MAGRTTGLNVCLIILILGACAAALGTKSAYYDLFTDFEKAKEYSKETLSGLQGMIIVDSIMLFFYLLALVFAIKPNPGIAKILAILILLLLIARIILALLFLAGDEEAIKKQVDACEDAPEEICYNFGTGQRCTPTRCGMDDFKKMRGAWIMEIIAVILVTLLAPVTCVLLLKS